ncbi:nuclear transport factor 2 family protein [Brevundimonas sp.]|jgi:hypothetical protein|uniref:nuclear transport factor 2 family protein n=1 Tax=Brevundimonas sp. TaxID=1871086 RepID=UPI002E148CE7|nr:nuclear transport factor 2 family protein [Brevundimonas sp.]
MSDRSPIKVVRAFFEELSGGDVNAITRHTSPDVVYVIYGEDPASRSAIPWAGLHRGHEALKSAFSAIYAELRVEAFEVETMFAEGEFVAIFGSYRAVSAKTGQRFTTPFAQRARVVDGAVVHCVMSEDSGAVAAAIKGD